MLTRTHYEQPGRIAGLLGPSQRSQIDRVQEARFRRAQTVWLGRRIRF